MAFDEGRRGRGQPRFVGQSDIGGVPARTGTYALRMLESGQKLMPQEGVPVSTQGIPLPWIELVNAVMEARSWRSRGQECFSMSKVSR
jgi:hypothetical protein